MWNWIIQKQHNPRAIRPNSQHLSHQISLPASNTHSPPSQKSSPYSEGIYAHKSRAISPSPCHLSQISTPATTSWDLRQVIGSLHILLLATEKGRKPTFAILPNALQGIADLT